LKKKLSISLYWKCQVIGWSVAALYWSYQGYINGGFNFLLGSVKFVFDISLYIMITHLYRNFALKHKWQNLGLRELIKRIIPAAFVLGITYLLVTSLDVYYFSVLFRPGYSQSFSLFFKNNGVVTFIAGMRLMSIWLLAYHLYHYAQREINITKENARLELITRDAQLNNLSAQLNPHFLFNSLNNIKALIVENPKSARRAIDLLSDLLRTALSRRDVQLVTITEELNLVRDFLELEKLRFEERLQFCIECDETLRDILIIRFCIQTLVENAIKHGINQQKDGGIICIKIKSVEDIIKITVQNPGKLNIDPDREGLGLKNLGERLKLQYKGEAKFAIANKDEGAILATIVIPRS
jgi:sensor histidine kinase YesM